MAWYPPTRPGCQAIVAIVPMTITILILVVGSEHTTHMGSTWGAHAMHTYEHTCDTHMGSTHVMHTYEHTCDTHMGSTWEAHTWGAHGKHTQGLVHLVYCECPQFKPLHTCIQLRAHNGTAISSTKGSQVVGLTLVRVCNSKLVGIIEPY